MSDMVRVKSPRAIEDLRKSLRGEVIERRSDRYEESRVLFYFGFSRRPAAIVKPAGVEDVVRTVTYASERGIPLAVRSGGHSTAGHSSCDDGIVLDLSSMRGIEIDPNARTAWAEAGMTAGEYTAAVARHGLATGFGDTGSVGIGGITLGGGVGLLHRKYGLTIDNLLAADVVTADGRVLRVDREHEPDLFWAIRGGGGNFGVVTRFQYRLHEVTTVYGGMILLPASPDVVAGFLQEAAAAPEELAGMINLAPAPRIPFIPAEYHGKPVVMAILVYAGDPAAGERALAPFRALATPIIDTLAALPYASMYEGEENAPHPAAVATHSLYVDSIASDSIGGIIEELLASTAPMRVAQFRILGGAVARIPSDDSAFANRTRGVLVNIGAAFPDPSEVTTHQRWADRLAALIAPGEHGGYIGFMGNEGEERVRAAYGGPTWDRLRRIKGRYDPQNVFHFNQNIPPA